MDFSNDLSVIILAAGKGKRMKSENPKVLHKICGRPIIYYILKQIEALDPKNIITVIGYKKEQVRKYLEESFPEIRTVDQDEQAGTAHAVLMADKYFPKMCKNILVLSGDSPLITSDTLKSLIDLREEKNLSVSILTSISDDPYGYGRIIKDRSGKILKIVEEVDATPEEKEIDEVNSSIYCFEKETLIENIGKIGAGNAQGEYYLTDMIEMFIDKGKKVASFTVYDHDEASGINDRVQLALAEESIRDRINKRHMKNGVTIRNPSSVFIEDAVIIEADAVIESSCFLNGSTVIEKEANIGPFSQITDSRIAQNTVVNSSVIMGAEIGPENNIGPYSYIRPNTVTGRRVKIGAFCEVKRSSIGEGSKVPHLSYIGDTEMGSGVNIGASSVTVNYNGFSKLKTIIEDDVFIGSDTMLIAPIRIGEGAIVAAGSVVTRDVPGDALAIERAKQKNIGKGAIKYRNRKNIDRE